jgi:hypothetical protein
MLLWRVACRLLLPHALQMLSCCAGGRKRCSLHVLPAQRCSWWCGRGCALRVRGVQAALWWHPRDCACTPLRCSARLRVGALLAWCSAWRCAAGAAAPAPLNCFARACCSGCAALGRLRSLMTGAHTQPGWVPQLRFTHVQRQDSSSWRAAASGSRGAGCEATRGAAPRAQHPRAPGLPYTFARICPYGPPTSSGREIVLLSGMGGAGGAAPGGAAPPPAAAPSDKACYYLAVSQILSIPGNHRPPLPWANFRLN